MGVPMATMAGIDYFPDCPEWLAERLVVNDYLSAKYNISILAASDKYAGDLAVNGDYPIFD